MLHIVAVLLVLTAAFSYLNHRYLQLADDDRRHGHRARGVARDHRPRQARLRHAAAGASTQLLMSIDFTDVLMQGMLSFLLFAGALHVDINQLRRVAWPVGVLALVGTAMSTLIIGYRQLVISSSALGIADPVDSTACCSGRSSRRPIPSRCSGS